MQTAASPLATVGRILIVEDEALIAMDLKRRLERVGYVVADVASSGDEAIRLAASHCPDLILMDIRIQGARDGIDVADEIRTKFDIPVIFLTAHADDETLDRARRVQPQGYIIKPFGTTDFRARIEVACYTPPNGTPGPR